MGLLDLNRVIKYRLSITQFPRQITDIVISGFFTASLNIYIYILENGRVIFTVPHEFKVSLTMTSDALDSPWRILAIHFLVTDPEKNCKSSCLFSAPFCCMINFYAPFSIVLQQDPL